MRPARGLQRPAATIFSVPNWQRRKREPNWRHGAKFAEAGRLSQHSRRVRSPEIAILNFRVRDYLNLVDDPGCVVSTEHVTLPHESH